jgi:glyceraldehyde 3-phosphate dehydrogenase
MKKSVKKAKKTGKNGNSVQNSVSEKGKFKVAINGFGRIGKQFLLACIAKKVDWEFIINDLTDIENIAYSLKYDSVHPQKEKILHDKFNIFIGEKKVKVINVADVAELPWGKERIDLVVDCSGRFTDAKEAYRHIEAGAKRVLISAPAKNHDITIVPGINDSSLTGEHLVVSAGSCTTNCIAPMIKILNDALEIESAQFITTHALTSTQKLIDAHDKKDPRRGRAAASNISPSTSGASISVIEVIPEIKGKLEGYSLRVPVIDGSISSVIAKVNKKTSVKELNALFRKLAETKMKGILEYTEEPIVSSDIIGNPSSCIFDSSLTSVNGHLVSIAGWYDNEIGYSNRLVDVSGMMLAKI